MKNKIKKQNSKHESVFKMLLSILVMTACFFQSTEAFSQETGRIQVKGVVSDEARETLIGATVTEKGTSNAVITGIDGDYTLSVAPNATLVVVYIGFQSQEVNVGGRQKVDIVLKADSQALDEVVVTALGIKRDKKSLGYALSEVKGSELLETQSANIANSLAGKVAGLQIKSAPSGAAGSSRIILRGNNSIGGNNQPLVVVDGVPIDSGTGADRDDMNGEGIYDRGAGMSDISPDDIESISVLKGPAAAALYGSRAGNGVIMITTKTGKGTNGIGISYSSNLTFDSPMMKPKFQNQFGQGINGEYLKNEKFSWGGKMDGTTVTDYAGRSIKYAPGANMDDFLRTGYTWTNSIDLTSAREDNSVRLGVTNLNNEGIIPGNDFRRTSVTMRGTAALTKKLSVDAKVTYVYANNNNMPKLAGSPDNIFNQFLKMPRSIQMSDFSVGDKGYSPEYKGYNINPYAWGLNPDGTDLISSGDKKLTGRPVSYYDPESGNVANPYWSAYKNTSNDRRHRFIGMGSIKYELTDWLNVQARYGMDYSSSQLKDIQASGSMSWYGDKNGNLIVSKNEQYQVNTDFLFTLNKQFDKFGILATAGGNIMYSRSDGIWASSRGLAIEYFYNLSNGLDKDITNSTYTKQINSLYATSSLSWDNMLYLDLSARNDWSSTLNPNNRSYFYPSVGASWLFTETFNRDGNKLGPLNYGKLRLSWAQVGNDTDPYSLYNYRTISVTNGKNEMIGLSAPGLANYDLKNETINSWEIGLEMSAFKNRVGLDFAFYNKNAKDQLLKLPLPASTGYLYRLVNAGNVRNRGVELMLRGTPIQTKDFSWDVTLNWSKNDNKIIELGEYNGRKIQQQQLSHLSYQGTIIVVANEGGSFGDMYGIVYDRDANGNLKLDSKGLPTSKAQFEKLGNYNPKWMGGINNTFRYKDFDLAFQIDMRYGGDVYMGSYSTGAAAGTLDFTAANDRSTIKLTGVNEAGETVTSEIKAQDYWSTVSGITEEWIRDATNIRLRELSIGYKFPRKLLMKTPISSAKLSFVARNLWMIHSKTKGFDPEAGFSTGNAQGIEMGSMPTLRSLGFNLNVTF